MQHYGIDKNVCRLSDFLVKFIADFPMSGFHLNGRFATSLVHQSILLRTVPLKTRLEPISKCPDIICVKSTIKTLFINQQHI